MVEKRADTKEYKDENVWCLLLRTWFAILRLRQIELSSFGMTVEQSSILTVIEHAHGSATARELELYTMRQQHSISTLVNRMLKAGLLDKEKEQGEKRNRIIITEAGRDILKQLPTDSIKTVFSALDNSEKKNLFRYLCAINFKTRELLGVTRTLPFLRNERDVKTENLFDNDSGGRMTSYELWKRFDSAGFTVSRLRELELAQFELTLEQSLMLTIIDHCGGSTTTKEIENLTLRQHNSVSTLINRMSKTGLIKKERFGSDRRYRVTMTDEGRKLFDTVEMVSIEMAFSCLSQEEKQYFYKYLASLHREARLLLGIDD